MNILYLTRPLAGLLMIGMPIALAVVITRKFHYSWRLVGIGAMTFVLSQVGHIPFNAVLSRMFTDGRLPSPPDHLRLVFFAVLWGLSAGVWEESFRYGAYRWFAREARSWGGGLLLGAGHGGIEAVLLGLIVLLNFVILAATRGQDASIFFSAQQASPELVEVAQAQIEAYWSQPWLLSLMSAVERMFTLPIHLACSLLVMQVFTRGQARWIFLSVGWHAAVNATALILLGGVWSQVWWGSYALEGVVGLFALASLGIILALRQPEPQPVAPLPLPPIQPVPIPVIETQTDDLERSRYSQ